jgi:hypothetical protein
LVSQEFEDFMANSMMWFACIKQVKIIDALSNHVLDATINSFLSIRWA